MTILKYSKYVDTENFQLFWAQHLYVAKFQFYQLKSQ